MKQKFSYKQAQIANSFGAQLVTSNTALQNYYHGSAITSLAWSDFNFNYVYIGPQSSPSRYSNFAGKCSRQDIQR